MVLGAAKFTNLVRYRNDLQMKGMKTATITTMNLKKMTTIQRLTTAMTMINW